MLRLWNRQWLQNYTLSRFMQRLGKLPYKVLIRRRLGFSNLFKVASILNQRNGGIENELRFLVCLSCQSPDCFSRTYRMYVLLKWPPLMLISSGGMITKTRVVLQGREAFCKLRGKGRIFCFKTDNA